MKKWITYFLGVLTGLLIAFVVYFVFLSSDKDKTVDEKEIQVVEQEEDGKDEEDVVEDESPRQLLDGVTLFDEVGDVINEKSFKVMQVIADDAALAHGNDEYDLYLGTLYLITNSDKKYYYDDEIIKVPQGKVVRQIGIYRYVTTNETMKTVPIVMIMDKN